MSFSLSSSSPLSRSHSDPYTTPPLTSRNSTNNNKRMMQVTITPPSPIHLELPRGASPSSSSNNNNDEQRKQSLLKRFNQEYNHFINFKHSINVSPSNAHPEQSISLELNQLRLWTSRAMAFITSALDETKNTVALDMIEKTNISISKHADHIEARIKTLSASTSPSTSASSTPRQIVSVSVPKKRSHKETRAPTPTRAAVIKSNSNSNNYRFRDEKQSRDCIRRVVVAFYLKEYLEIHFEATVPATFICTEEFILNNKHLFSKHINEFGKRTFKSLNHVPPTYDYTNNEHVVRAFIQHCLREMQEIITYLTYLLKRDANEFNYDNSRFQDVPVVLMNRIRIRLIKDNKYSPQQKVALTTESTAIYIFHAVNTRYSINTDTDTDIETDKEEIDTDDEVLTIMDEDMD